MSVDYFFDFNDIDGSICIFFLDFKFIVAMYM